ncbi:hypothetical protein D3C75_751360 [compost metagenome]
MNPSLPLQQIPLIQALPRLTESRLQPFRKSGRKAKPDIQLYTVCLPNGLVDPVHPFFRLCNIGPQQKNNIHTALPAAESEAALLRGKHFVADIRQHKRGQSHIAVKSLQQPAVRSLERDHRDSAIGHKQRHAQLFAQRIPQFLKRSLSRHQIREHLIPVERPQHIQLHILAVRLVPLLFLLQPQLKSMLGGGDQLLAVQRLQQIICSTVDNRRLHIIEVLIAADYDGLRMRIMAVQPLQQLGSIHERHPHIREDNRGLLLLHDPHRFLPVGRLIDIGNMMLLPWHKIADRLPHMLLIVYYQHLHCLPLLCVSDLIFIQME